MRKLVLLACVALSSASAGTLTDLSFISNGGSYVNNTIVDGTTSPLAFIASGSTSNPFLNNPDSTIALGYGDYYAIAFLGFGQHVGAGTISFTLDGITPFSQNVTFPANSPGGVQFASFNLGNGDTVTVTTTGLSADRLSIIADAGGLQPDGTADAFYLFSYTQASGVPEPGTFSLMAAGIMAALAFRSPRVRSLIKR